MRATIPVSECKTRANRIPEVMAAGARVVGQEAEDPGAGVEGMGAKVMKSARKCMNS